MKRFFRKWGLWLAALAILLAAAATVLFWPRGSAAAARFAVRFIPILRFFAEYGTKKERHGPWDGGVLLSLSPTLFSIIPEKAARRYAQNA